MTRRRKRSRKQAGQASREASPGPVTRPGRRLWEWAKSISVAFLLFLVLRTFVVEAFHIPTGSMENTLLVGDILLVNKAVYGAEVPLTGLRTPAMEQPELGDVVVLKHPRESITLVKRVSGVPGDEVAMRGGNLYVNGVLQDEPYVQHSGPGDQYDASFGWQVEYLALGTDPGSYRPTRDNWGPVVVPEGRYFVMGDNRDNSLDSRHWGFADRTLILGRPLVIYYSFDRSKLRFLPWLTEIRWNRLGTRVR